MVTPGIEGKVLHEASRGTPIVCLRYTGHGVDAVCDALQARRLGQNPRVTTKEGEVYNFPERGLLASLPFEAIKSLKNIFNKNVRQEVLTLTFNADSLMIKGEQVKTELTLKREAFDKHCYAHYIVGD